jgi:hypothetical protein
MYSNTMLFLATIKGSSTFFLSYSCIQALFLESQHVYLSPKRQLLACRAVQIQTKESSKDRPWIVRRTHDHESNTIHQVM